MDIYQQIPSKVDLFDSTMVEKYVKMNSVQSNTAYQAFFGNPANGSKSLFVDDAINVKINLANGKNSKSTFGQRGVPISTGAKRKNRQGTNFAEANYQFPIIKDSGDITAMDTFTRGINEMTDRGVSPVSRFERTRQIAGEIYTDIIIDQCYQFEYLASESILTGQMPVDETGGYYDFKRNPDNNLNAARPWADPLSTPLLDCDTVLKRVHRNGKVKPDFIGMDVVSFNDFINHDSVKGIADNRGYNFVSMGKLETKPDSKYDRWIKAGWTPVGMLRTVSGYNAWIFTDNSYYEAENGDQIDYTPLGTVVGASTDTRNDRYFGPSDVLPDQFDKFSVKQELMGITSAVTSDPLVIGGMDKGRDSIIDPRMFKFLASCAPGNSTVNLEVQSSPIYANTNSDGIAVMKLTAV